MSLLLKAFPHGRPHPRAPRALLVLVLVTSLALVALPMGDVAQARDTHRAAKVTHAKHVKKHPKKHKAVHKKHAKKKVTRAAKAKVKSRKKPQKKAQKKTQPPRVPGQPGRSYVMPQGSIFSFPNKGKAATLAIRNRVRYTVESVWGGGRDATGAPLPTNGSIRMATWSFDDWPLARALVAAKKRGVSVQIVAAKKINRDHASWRWLRKKLGSQLFRPGYPATNTMWSFARECRGSCRGRFGTAHAKYFLFDNVGAGHARKVTMQTSMNLTTFASTGQWNQAFVSYVPPMYDDFLTIFRQARLNKPQVQPFHTATVGPLHDFFFPRYGVTPQLDPVYQFLDGVRCLGATAGSTGRTQINVDQYAIYGARGEWLARKLRYLWQAGCNLSIIYSVASRPVLAILRNGSGRGPIPMRQSVITDGYGTIVKYNHSKWITVVGWWKNNPASYLTMAGSANWANLATGSDEQFQLINGRTEAVKYLLNFAATWSQSSSHMPGYGVLPNITGRVIPTFSRDVPINEPEWGKGVFKYMTPD